jgi:hypothetical protein
MYILMCGGSTGQAAGPPPTLHSHYLEKLHTEKLAAIQISIIIKV